MTPRRLALLIWFVACAVWHATAVHAELDLATRLRDGRDFASYYYAVQVAAEGGDPYDVHALSEMARGEGTRRYVHPFFYPPPFVLVTAWVAPFELRSAYMLWFWLDELAVLAAALALGLWWRRLGTVVPVALAGAVALLTAIPNNHVMGQANLVVLGVVVLGLWAEARDRTWLGGALIGLACMMKMSPALFVMWWMVRGRWTPVIVACLTAVVLSVAALPLVGFEHQWRFYTEVLPTFRTGRYNGLGVGIDLFGNHSIPNLYDDWFPAGPKHLILSETARQLTAVTTLVTLAGLGFAFWRTSDDGLTRAAQVGAVATAMLLIPAITYEHHLVWLIPAAVATSAAVMQRRLHPAWVPALALAWLLWCYDLQALKKLYQSILPTQPLLAFLVREAKLAAELVFFAACVAAGMHRGEDV